MIKWLQIILQIIGAIAGYLRESRLLQAGRAEAERDALAASNEARKESEKNLDRIRRMSDDERRRLRDKISGR